MTISELTLKSRDEAQPRHCPVKVMEGTVRNSVREAGFRHWLTNLSPNTTANWVLASNHSRGGRFHSS
ncbi:hypothetical protein O7A70_32080, partial [Mesorhizobium sp. Cs1299R1N1]|uniref:hypothetical protein n=1 Tax=Mesorhizobium sp. Cs1299R1N1 TaxID=3015172 RepID=UPI00301E2F4A